MIDFVEYWTHRAVVIPSSRFSFYVYLSCRFVVNLIQQWRRAVSVQRDCPETPDRLFHVTEPAQAWTCSWRSATYPSVQFEAAAWTQTRIAQTEENSRKWAHFIILIAYDIFTPCAINFAVNTQLCGWRYGTFHAWFLTALLKIEL